jgi:NTP pyrophosphatase (non-canonical NTP hydrolase)
VRGWTQLFLQEVRMTIDEYAAWAARTAGVGDNPNREKLAYLGLGIAGESGEVAEHFKKLLRDGTLDKEGLAEELGDVIYYWACLCRVAGVAPADVMAASRTKIDGRIAAARASGS